MTVPTVFSKKSYEIQSGSIINEIVETYNDRSGDEQLFSAKHDLRHLSCVTHQSNQGRGRNGKNVDFRIKSLSNQIDLHLIFLLYVYEKHIDII